MTTTSTMEPAPAPVTHPQSVGFGNVLRSEWTKLRSLRSTFWCAAIVVIAMLGIAVVMGVRWADVLASDSPQKRAGFDVANTVLGGAYIAQVVVGAFGVLAISSEYGTGMIRASLAAVPQRRTLLAAKMLVVTAVVLVLAEALSFSAFAIGNALLNRRDFGTSLTHPGVLRAVFGAGLYLTAVALLGFGLGALIRHTAGALSTFFGVLFALTALSDLLPTTWRDHVINYMPANAGSQIFVVYPVHDALAPWTGLAVFCAYAAAAIGAAFLVIDRRDA